MVQSGNNIGFIWENFLDGEKEAFAKVYNLFVNDLYRYGTKLCNNESFVKDAIQEVFLDLYLKRQKNKTKPEHLKYYLLLALKRNLVKKIKNNRRTDGQAVENELLFEPDYCIEQLIIEQEEDNERKKRVLHALNQLPPKQKEAVYLRFNESMTYTEIASLLNISVESVRKQVYRALKTVREICCKESIILWFTQIYK